MRAMVIAFVLFGGAAGCLTAVTPDGRQYSCVTYRDKDPHRNNERRALVTVLAGPDGKQYSCIGHTQPIGPGAGQHDLIAAGKVASDKPATAIAASDKH